jgi:superoxide dismutase, Fe-Mn family
MVDIANQLEGSGATQQSPTAQPTPPGVSPQSPLSGVSGSSPQNPDKLNSRFIHTSAVRAQSLSSNIAQATAERSHMYDEGVVSKPKEPVSRVEALNTGEVLYPLFCISVHEHAWLSAGFGVWGKEEWLKKFWSVLDWKKVSNSYDTIFKDPYRIAN